MAPSRKKIVGPAAQGLAAATYLNRYTDPGAMQLAVVSLFDNVVWSAPHTAEHSEEQFRLLGLHLGFESTRPEKEFSDGGPDNLWALTPGSYAVVELKTEVSRPNPVIIKSESEQLVHSLAWFEDTYPNDAQSVPVLLHPSSLLDSQAHVPPGTRMITPTHWAELRKDVGAFVNELGKAQSWADPAAVAEGLKRHHLTAEQVLARHSSKPTRK